MLQNLNLNRTLRNYIALTGLVAGVFSAHALTLPAQTTIPVAFVHGIDAHKAKAGDVVTAKSMQQVVLAGGETIPKGTLPGWACCRGQRLSVRRDTVCKAKAVSTCDPIRQAGRKGNGDSCPHLGASGPQTPLNRGTPRSPSTLMKAITSARCT